MYNNNLAATSPAMLIHKPDGRLLWVVAGVTIGVLMLAVVCLMFHQTLTPSAADASQKSNNTDSPKTVASIALVCAMFATVFFSASVCWITQSLSSNLRYRWPGMAQVGRFLPDSHVCSKSASKSCSDNAVNLCQSTTSNVYCYLAGDECVWSTGDAGG
jgi:flagellar basal body-associated protein FliL